MFHRLGHFVVKRAWWVIIAWVIGSIALVAGAPKLSASTDESEFLPKHYESIRASVVQQDKFPAEFTPGAILMFERTDGGALTDADKADMARITQGLTDKHIPLVEQVIPPMPGKTVSQDGHYAMGMVSIDKTKMQTDEYPKAAKDLRDEGKELAKGTALKFQVGGQAAMAQDQKESSSATDAITMVATIVLIVVIVGVIFRGILVGWLPVLLSLFPMIAASGLIAFVTDIFDLKSSPIASAIDIVVILGVGTDYFLFLMFRYRERLRAGDDRKAAVANGVGRVGEAIASAAGAVTVAFAVLLLSELGMFTSLGPALAISVIVTALASLTLTPALLSVIPAKATFWPGRKWMQEPTGARFHKLGKVVGRRPGIIALASGGLLVVLSLAGLGYTGTFDMAKSMMPKDKESMVVMDALTKGFSAGAADPTHVFVTGKNGAKLDAAALDGFGAKLGQVPGVATVQAEHKLSEDGTTADFTVMLKDAAASNAAIDTVTELRTAAHADAPAGTEALVGGTSSVYKDINLAMTHDYKLVFPVAGVLILLILGLQLRSVVAPWYLMASVGLGFAATLGATTVAFLKIGTQPGLMFMLPIFIYLFVVAIGTDYNILIIARLREEAREGRDPREAAKEAVRHAGPTVAAAGFILAASFATFMLAGNVLFAELGFALAIGIVLAAFVMAMFFTPAITALLGKKAWWPGHGAMPDHGPEAVGAREPQPAGRA
ncbi:MMPL family transporter [Kitasatospora sp. NPDC059646]|uniref:MMPL family transporter n=1 Tax=Kitasatospora sp. NPDC059646 TaxID=3346893 RepID=UPI0036B57FA7